MVYGSVTIIVFEIFSRNFFQLFKIKPKKLFRSFHAKMEGCCLRWVAEISPKSIMPMEVIRGGF